MNMIKAIQQEDYYNHSCFCDGCGRLLLYNSEDIARDDNIICPVCGERNEV